MILSEDGVGAKLNRIVPGYKLILGSVPYQNPLLPSNSQATTMNLYETPISFDAFINFIAVKIVGGRKRTYRFLEFLEDLVEFLIEKAFSTYKKEQTLSAANSFKLELVPLALNRNFIASANTNTGRLTFGPNSPPFLTSLSTIKSITNCFFIYGRKVGSSGVYTTGLEGSITADEGQGILHFLVGGPPTGILKEIKFSEQRSNAFNTAVMRRSLAAGTTNAIVPAKYTTKMKLVGAPFFNIGQLFYVNTYLMDGGYFAIENLGFGGYYQINKVDHYYGPDQYETQVEGILHLNDRIVRGATLAEKHLITPLEYNLQTRPPPPDVLRHANLTAQNDQSKRNEILQQYYDGTLVLPVTAPPDASGQGDINVDAGTVNPFEQAPITDQDRVLRARRQASIVATGLHESTGGASTLGAANLAAYVVGGLPGLGVTTTVGAAHYGAGGIDYVFGTNTQGTVDSGITLAADTLGIPTHDVSPSGVPVVGSPEHQALVDEYAAEQERKRQWVQDRQEDLEEFAETVKDNLGF